MKRLHISICSNMEAILYKGVNIKLIMYLHGCEQIHFETKMPYLPYSTENIDSRLTKFSQISLEPVADYADYLRFRRRQ